MYETPEVEKMDSKTGPFPLWSNLQPSWIT